MKKLASLFFLFSAFSVFSQAPNLDQQAYDSLLKRFHGYVDDGVLAGTVIYLEKDGLLTKDFYGYQNREEGTVMSENSIFRLASMTKPIVAAGIMILVERGMLDLDAPAAKYLPDLRKMRLYDGSEAGVEPRETMTVRHLLSHTSGITSGFDLSEAGKAAAVQLKGEKVSNLEELVAAVCRTQLAFEPGRGWSYGYGNDVLAAIIERVTGQSIDLFLKQHLFEPLQMRHTGFQAADAGALTSVYAYGQSGALEAVENVTNSPYIDGTNFPRGNGGLTSVAGDYLNFCRMILDGGVFQGKRILSAGSVRMMMENQVKPRFLPLKVGPTEMTGQGYGLGLGVLTEDAPFGSEGDVFWPGALYTYFFISPDKRSIGIFMTQLNDRTKMGLLWEFHEMAAGSLLGEGNR